LLSNDVQTVLRWSQTGNNHPRFRASTVLGLPIPRKLILLIKKLNNLSTDALKTFESAINLYPEAEAELLEKIGWQQLNKQPSELYYSVDSGVLSRHERIDPEHYQPKFIRLFDRLRKIGAKAIGNFSATPQRGIQPVFSENGQVAVIDSKAVRPLGVEPDKAECTSLKFVNSLYATKGRIRRGDVLLNSTGVGTLGRASFYDSDGLALADNHVAIIRPDPKICLPVYLSLFLNSPAGLAQSVILVFQK
jgi:type I restriction enzyme, S subunit